MSKNVDRTSIIDRNIDELSRLTTFDQLDVKFVLLTQFLALSELMRNPEVDESIIETHILGLNALIPDSLKDEQFTEDSKNAVISVKKDCRKEWCGRKVGQPKFEDVDVLNPIRLLNAITNLFDRSGLWLRKTPKTVFRGKHYGDRKANSET
jgi:hypothetical protein